MPRKIAVVSLTSSRRLKSSFETSSFPASILLGWGIRKRKEETLRSMVKYQVEGIGHVGYIGSL